MAFFAVGYPTCGRGEERERRDKRIFVFGFRDRYGMS